MAHVRLIVPVACAAMACSAPCSPGETSAAARADCVDLPGAVVAPDTSTAFAQVGTHGADVSHHNGAVAWRTLREGGLRYVFVKATQGLREVDPAFAAHWAAAARCGVRRGAYHFLDPDVDARAQARHFLATLGDDGGELPPVLDVERGFGGSRRSCAELERDVLTFVGEVDRALGTRTIIYSGHGFWTTALCDTHALRDRPLWVAHYTTEGPKLFGGWSEWAFWQYTDHFRMKRSALDLDRASDQGRALMARAHR